MIGIESADLSLAQAMGTVNVLYATDRVALQTGGFANGHRGVANTFGDCTVRLEPGRKRGAHGPQNASSITAMRQEAGRNWAAQMQGEAVLLFVHGYNTSFEAAVVKAAQLKVDMPWSGPIIAFSWPSHGDTLDYSGDEALYQESIPSFLDTLHFLQVGVGDCPPF